MHVTIFDPSCPYCGKKNECHTSAGKENWTPDESGGSVSMCISCGEFSIYIENGLRKMNEKDIQEMSKNKEFMNMLLLHRLAFLKMDKIRKDKK